MKQSRNNRHRGVIATEIFETLSRISYIFKTRNSTVVGGKYKVGVTTSEIVKYIVYGILGIFLILLEITFFTRVRPFDSTPDILIVATAAVAMFEGERVGAIFGVSVGAIASAVGCVGLSLLPLVYMLVGYGCGIVASEYYRRSVLLFIIFDLSALAVRLFTTLISIVTTWGTVDLSVVVPDVLIPELLSTLVISPVPGLLVLPVYLIFRDKSEKKPGLD